MVEDLPSHMLTNIELQQSINYPKNTTDFLNNDTSINHPRESQLNDSKDSDPTYIVDTTPNIQESQLNNKRPMMPYATLEKSVPKF